VQALHDHSLVHFDLKPANVFLKGDVARVGDYGLSKLVSESRNSLSFSRGTPYYMAPEMLQRRGDARSDIYSLGIILFECLYGDVPFRGDSEWEVLKKHEVAMPEFPAAALPADRAVILRCMAKKPEDRFASVTELLHALQAPAALGESLLLGPLDRHAGEGKPADLRTAARREPPPLPDGVRRDPADSPYGMPWRDEPPRGVLALLVRFVFHVLEAAIFVLLLPVRAVSAFAGRGVLWTVKLPFRILGLTAKLVGLLLVLGLITLVGVSIVYLLAAA